MNAKQITSTQRVSKTEARSMAQLSNAIVRNSHANLARINTVREVLIELASHKDTDEQQGRAVCVRLNRMAEELTFAMQQMIANHYGVTI